MTSGITTHREVAVCSRCLTEACWNGELCCEDYRSAGMIKGSEPSLEHIREIARERAALHAQRDRCQAALRRALSELGMDHTGHWDRTGRSGGGCEVCQREREVRDEIRRVLDRGEDRG